MGIVFSCEHCCNFSNGFDCDTCTNQDKFSNVAKPNLNAVLADVPSLQEYLNWALEPEDGFRTHEEIYNYFARYFS